MTVTKITILKQGGQPEILDTNITVKELGAILADTPNAVKAIIETDISTLEILKDAEGNIKGIGNKKEFII